MPTPLKELLDSFHRFREWKCGGHNAPYPPNESLLYATARDARQASDILGGQDRDIINALCALFMELAQRVESAGSMDAEVWSQFRTLFDQADKLIQYLNGPHDVARATSLLRGIQDIWDARRGGL